MRSTPTLNSSSKAAQDAITSTMSLVSQSQEMEMEMELMQGTRVQGLAFEATRPHGARKPRRNRHRSTDRRSSRLAIPTGKESFEEPRTEEKRVGQPYTKEELMEDAIGIGTEIEGTDDSRVLATETEAERRYRWSVQSSRRSANPSQGWTLLMARTRSLQASETGFGT